MGFHEVYASLRELFPEVDARALRAVSFEHSKDVDEAVIQVLEEIIPFFNKRSAPTTPLSLSVSVGESSEASSPLSPSVSVSGSSEASSSNTRSFNTLWAGNSTVKKEALDQVQNGYSVSEGGISSEPFNDPCNEHHEEEENTAELALSLETRENRKKVKASESLLNENEVKTYEEPVIEIVRYHPETGKAFSAYHNLESGGNVSEKIDHLQEKESIAGGEDHNVSVDSLQIDMPNMNGSNSDKSELSEGESLVVIDENRVQTHETEISEDPETKKAVSAYNNPESGEVSCGSNNIQRLMLQELDMGVSKKSDCIVENEDIADVSLNTSVSSAKMVEMPNMNGSNLDILELSLSTDTASNRKNMSNEDGSASNVTMFSQIRTVDIIDEVIADARNNKKTLFLEMESVINLMKEVEIKEKAAEQAKKEAEIGGMDLLNQVEELKLMLQQAKESNDMNAGEVYGEKAILATELRELQSRVRSVSDERDVSLAILDEMRQSLEVRLSAAVNEVKYAEQRKLEKEDVARKLLAEQELVMEKVVQESKILRQQAEDNAKLEEFLLDRGRIVDTLQGEIGVICQDVKLLKERFDQQAPLGKSLFSSQTSFLLASSNSSLKSSVPNQLENVAVENGDQSESENNRGHEEEAAREDDGWQIFDSSDLNN